LTFANHSQQVPIEQEALEACVAAPERAVFRGCLRVARPV
jgi:hypothetical protein